MITPNGIPLDSEFDVALADALAGLEIYNKHYYRPNTYLHKWWARRCGSTFRLILKHLAADDAARDYYAPGGLAGKVILDPMMGGGTTLHEAIRLEANVIGVDIDPIPVLQARATLSEVSPLALEQAFKRLYGRLRAELDPYFETTCPLCGVPTSMQYGLYGVRRRNGAGETAVLVDSLVLRQEKDGSVITLCPETGAVRQNGERFAAAVESVPILEKRDARAGEYEEDVAAAFYGRYQLLVLTGRCKRHGLFFKPPDEADWRRRQEADDARAGLPFAPAEFAVDAGRKSVDLTNRGIDNYLDLFSSRQLLYLQQAAAGLAAVEDGMVRLNLALLISTSLEFNSMLCGYKGAAKRRSGAIRHTFSHHAYWFPHTALENNPLYHRRASGTLSKLFHMRIRRGREWAQQPRERVLDGETAVFREIKGEMDLGTEVTAVAELRTGQRRFLLQQGSSTTLALPDGSVDYVVTDPPYYDSIQYSDLSAFFRVWLRRLLPQAANWQYDVADSAVDPHRNDAESRYEDLLAAIFGECHRVLRRDGRFIFTFHHWNPKGWAALTVALRQAEFVLVNRYVVHSESPISVHIAKMKALLHDAVLVLAPVEAGLGGDWERPSTINQDKSELFTRDCATLLGWMLNREAAPDEIRRGWREALR